MKNILTVRPAEERDVASIRGLIAIYAEKAIMLDRDEADIRFYLGNFVVAEADGVVRGCAAVRDFGGDLLEVRSLVVAPDFQSKGIGRALLEAIISGLSIRRSSWRLFTLTYQVDFFRKLGFEVVDRKMFPEKIWSDCSRCPKQSRCDEVALLMSSK
ncbi:MAG: GNAT family N-acetyltransferase [Victivallaceae bacterium]|nr:GNAT family N-acetyltransferase [Victivallaceae bacterium]